MSAGVFAKKDLKDLFDAVLSSGYLLVGPTLKEGVIVYDELSTVDDLPKGVVDHQSPGNYSIEKTSENTFFAYTIGPHSFKKYLDPPRRKLWEVKRDGDDLTMETPPEDEQGYAFLGVRACELNAIKIQDKVFINEEMPNTYYEKKRRDSLIISVHCQRASGNCFCPSMETGPEMPSGADLLLTELENDFIIQSFTPKGQAIVDKLNLQQADQSVLKETDLQVQKTKDSITKKFPKESAQKLLKNSPESSMWQEIATQCTSCANCTLACPTCFCSTVEDVTDLTGEHSERWKRWDSCFNPDFSYIHGGEVRKSTSSKYRQWLTHKFSYWNDQFDIQGCVGCGRCLTWCPVGIDFTDKIEMITGDATP